MSIFSKDPALKKISLLNPIHLISVGFGSGLFAKAPGTCGTVAAIPMYLLLNKYTTLNEYLAIICLSFILGVYFCDLTAKKMETHDHGAIVWDEIVGYFITMIASPVSPLSIIAGFVLFRFFDIKKPWIIKWADKNIAGGLGIMFDDVLAGIASMFCMWLLFGIWG